MTVIQIVGNNIPQFLKAVYQYEKAVYLKGAEVYDKTNWEEAQTDLTARGVQWMKHPLAKNSNPAPPLEKWVLSRQ